MNYRDPKEVELLVKGHAGKIMRRLRTAGAGFMSFEDVTQELWVAWMIAVDKFDPESGVPFKAYFTRGLRLHINRVIERHIERRGSMVFAQSLSAPADPELGDESLESFVPGETNTERDIVEKLTFERSLSRLKPQAQAFVKLLADMPEELCAEVAKGQAKAEHGRKMGIRVAITNRVTSNMIFDLLGYTTAERKTVLEQVERLGNKICQE